MVHRDVKPANLLLDDPASTRAYLTDFGVAKLTGGARETKAGMFIGSVDYASPEQIEGGEIAPAVDVYALGCMLYECLTGRRPYRKPTNVAILFGHLRDPIPLVTEGRTTCRRQSTRWSRPRSQRIRHSGMRRAASSRLRRERRSSAPPPRRRASGGTSARSPNVRSDRPCLRRSPRSSDAKRSSRSYARSSPIQTSGSSR